MAKETAIALAQWIEESEGLTKECLQSAIELTLENYERKILNSFRVPSELLGCDMPNPTKKQ